MGYFRVDEGVPSYSCTKPEHFEVKPRPARPTVGKIVVREVVVTNPRSPGPCPADMSEPLARVGSGLRVSIDLGCAGAGAGAGARR